MLRASNHFGRGTRARSRIPRSPSARTPLGTPDFRNDVGVTFDDANPVRRERRVRRPDRRGIKTRIRLRLRLSGRLHRRTHDGDGVPSPCNIPGRLAGGSTGRHAHSQAARLGGRRRRGPRNRTPPRARRRNGGGKNLRRADPFTGADEGAELSGAGGAEKKKKRVFEPVLEFGHGGRPASSRVGVGAGVDGASRGRRGRRRERRAARIAREGAQDGLEVIAYFIAEPVVGHVAAREGVGNLRNDNRVVFDAGVERRSLIDALVAASTSSDARSAPPRRRRDREGRIRGRGIARAGWGSWR